MAFLWERPRWTIEPLRYARGRSGEREVVLSRGKRSRGFGGRDSNPAAQWKKHSMAERLLGVGIVPVPTLEEAGSQPGCSSPRPLKLEGFVCPGGGGWTSSARVSVDPACSQGSRGAAERERRRQEGGRALCFRDTPHSYGSTSTT